MQSEMTGDVTVTSVGLLYFAMWYVLVYAGAVHMVPTLKVHLSQMGSTADKHLCAVVALEQVSESLGMIYATVNCKQMVQALESVFARLFDMSTILQVAELCIPELLTQLPYAKKLDLIPGTVKSVLEARDSRLVVSPRTQ